MEMEAAEEFHNEKAPEEVAATENAIKVTDARNNSEDGTDHNCTESHTLMDSNYTTCEEKTHWQEL